MIITTSNFFEKKGYYDAGTGLETLLITTCDGIDVDIMDGSEDGDGDNGGNKNVIVQKLVVTTRDGKNDDGKDANNFDVNHGDGHRMVVVINYDDDDDGDYYKK